jgi:hypothetical protein
MFLSISQKIHCEVVFRFHSSQKYTGSGFQVSLMSSKNTMTVVSGFHSLSKKNTLGVDFRFDWLSPTTHWDRISQEAGIGSRRHTKNSNA